MTSATEVFTVGDREAAPGYWLLEVASAVSGGSKDDVLDMEVAVHDTDGGLHTPMSTAWSSETNTVTNQTTVTATWVFAVPDGELGLRLVLPGGSVVDLTSLLQAEPTAEP